MRIVETNGKWVGMFQSSIRMAYLEMEFEFAKERQVPKVIMYKDDKGTDSGFQVNMDEENLINAVYEGCDVFTEEFRLEVSCAKIVYDTNTIQIEDIFKAFAYRICKAKYEREQRSRRKFDWLYNEMQQVGKDYADAEEVATYNASHAQFRDVRSEVSNALHVINLNAGQRVIDFGCGTGVFAIEAVKKGLHVTAVDVSQAMLDYAKQRAEEEGVAESIDFVHAGFLTYEFEPESADAITSSLSFHHLPDYWKLIALKRMYKMLKPGGIFYLYDVVITEEQSVENINALIAHQEEKGGDFLREDAIGHFKEEFSTFDWILDQMFDRAGFVIESKSIEAGLFATYHSRKAS